MKTPDRRDRSRISGEYPLRIHRGGAHRDEIVSGAILDVSIGGFRLSLDRPLVQGESIVLEVADPGGVHRDFPAVVSWCEPGAAGTFDAGAEFLEPLIRRHFIRLCALTCGAARLQ